jgi:hypothetical protein
MRVTRRRVLLGIGLDQRKLADTIAQLGRPDSPDAALICDVPENPDAWVQLTPVRSPDDVSHIVYWRLIAGYPIESPPLDHLPQTILWPDGALIDGWASGVYVRFTFAASVGAEVLSTIIEQVMTRVQGINVTSQVDVSLETE